MFIIHRAVLNDVARLASAPNDWNYAYRHRISVRFE